MGYAYPEQPASSVLKRWHGVGGAVEHERKRADEPETLPDAAALEELLSVCYQASLMREEERPVTFRAILGGPQSFPPDGGPPSGLHRLRLDAPRPFDAHELRRMSPGAEFHRALIAVEKDGDDSTNLRIWGSVHSGPRWIRRTQGGREVAPPLPPAPVVHVTGPGRLSVYRGDAYVAGLEEGGLREASMDVFASRWMPRRDLPVQQALYHLVRLTEPLGERREQLERELGTALHDLLYGGLLNGGDASVGHRLGEDILPASLDEVQLPEDTAVLYEGDGRLFVVAVDLVDPDNTREEEVELIIRIARREYSVFWLEPALYRTQTGPLEILQAEVVRRTRSRKAPRIVPEHIGCPSHSASCYR